MTVDELKQLASGGGGGLRLHEGGGSESSADKAKREELLKKNAEIIEKNKRLRSKRDTKPHFQGRPGRHGCKKL